MDENILNTPQESASDKEALMNELWYGSFTILKVPTQYPQYTLYVQAQIDTGAPPSGGWFSYAPLTKL
ncbi:MAG: hypothetical protein ABI406_14610 [Ktedonobacteraceae bacterium]